MICHDTVIEGSVAIGEGTIVHNHVSIKATTSNTTTDDSTIYSCSIGERNIIEDHVSINNSSIGHGNIIEVYTSIDNSTIGNFTRISPKVLIKGNSTIGNGCIISPGLVLDGVHIPDNTAVYGYGDSRWRCGPADNSITYPLGEAMRTAYLDPQSPQCLRNHFKEKTELNSSM